MKSRRKKQKERREGNERERQIKFITEHIEDTDRVKRREINVCVQTKEEVTDHRGKDKTSLVPKHGSVWDIKVYIHGISSALQKDNQLHAPAVLPRGKQSVKIQPKSG
jgi:endo-alpha-1,4-polygalactosaminidase (GH114 family)